MNNSNEPFVEFAQQNCSLFIQAYIFSLYRLIVKRFIRRALKTTETEENAMAAPAIIGLSKPKAATGMAMAL